MKGFVLGLTMLLAAALPAWSQAFPTSPYAPQPPINGVGVGFDLSNPAANMNNLVAAVNKILSPLIPYTPNATGFISLTPGAQGNGPMIGSYGAAASVNLKVVPQGNGNIVLFSSTNPLSTGLIKVGNLASWLPAKGLAACPAVVGGQAQIGMADHITGYLVVKDWLDRTHGMPGC